ncbi:hypothetical protein POM88_024745 [Heracleum sosnowskyi]|uniref:Uncharacterized protein n=1 Tax=Heracleum sosnowskyi TaxID=360622 RepID=A0AAD8MLQ6_9APIA|nr:hypothetical protein POM88_024745 [Heracleum sosnowskyi]
MNISLIMYAQNYNELTAEWEWNTSLIHGVAQEHAYIIQQLNQRKSDDNLALVVRAVDEDSNEMARYLARYGAEHWTQMVLISEPFGRIAEIWSHDTGLGPIEARFMHVREEDLNRAVMVDEVVDADEVLAEGNAY